MRKIFLPIISLFLLTFLGTTALAQKAILQTDCGKFECVEKSAHFGDKYGPGNWTDAGAKCICQYYTPEEWGKMYCGLARPSEEDLQLWRNCGVPVVGGPMSDPWGWVGEKEEGYEIHGPADLTQVTFLNYCSDPDWSPDGNQVIFERQKEGDRGIYLINADGTNLTKIGPGYNPSWSSVDNRIIYRGEDPWRSLFLVDLDEGWESKVKLVDQINEHGSWSLDGKKIVYSTPDGSESSSIWVMNSNGSRKTRLTTTEDGYCTGVSFSYDGSKIVYLKGFASYAVGGGEDEPNEVWVMDADGSNKHMIYAPGDSTQLIFQRAWNKNNKILFMRTWYRVKPPQVWMINADGSDPELVVSGTEDVFGDPVWDNSGTKVAISKSPVQPAVPGEIWMFSYEEPAEEIVVEPEEEITEETKEKVEEVPKNIFQKIWEAIINLFRRIFGI
jgi:Tol biopolymer transport system component